ncbi:DUF2141 domain-containing protein [Microvirga sp. CF3016]|uniref:DUF2141 domain-containing protein n=1 Tax=Microvirga sp. CF3016 TaxID=3110181 RepID=UPI002E75EADD|nr:DUF2141 domain-containing protein [Microvirga sp. CF3016]MEE1610647.1 DUF2141 domain-containing protein [Microvirga sp. CF3016]
MRHVGLTAALFLSVSSAHAATLTIRAEGVQPDQNMVYAGICDTSFEEITCPYKDRGQARSGTVELRIRNVKPGSYAIAVFHDINGNGRLDRSFIGLPNEPYGFSNDVGRRGPPSFEAARIVVKEPATTVVIPIR